MEVGQTRTDLRAPPSKGDSRTPANKLAVPWISSSYGTVWRLSPIRFETKGELRFQVVEFDLLM